MVKRKERVQRGGVEEHKWTSFKEVTALPSSTFSNPISGKKKPRMKVTQEGRARARRGKDGIGKGDR